MLQPLIDVARQ